jgi:hypothetical protein
MTVVLRDHTARVCVIVARLPSRSSAHSCLTPYVLYIRFFASQPQAVVCATVLLDLAHCDQLVQRSSAPRPVKNKGLLGQVASEPTPVQQLAEALDSTAVAVSW